MKFDTAWLFYRSNVAIARAAKVSAQAVSQWKAKGVIPITSAVVLVEHSHGKLQVDPLAYSEKRAAG